MNEIAIPDQTGQLEPSHQQPEPQMGSELMQWVNDARQAALVAQSLAKTSFVPASLRGKPEDITAAILAGQELGMKPMATLKSIDVIQGTPALRAHAMRALVQSHGHEIELVESTPEKCTMRGRRKGAEAWQPVTWDLARAEQMQLTGKPEWKKQPQTMLIARATGELCRLIAADVLHGMPYAAEELAGIAHAEIVPDRPALSVADLTADEDDAA
ncbi:hypothetical protein ACIRD2_03315 [Streptomyces sp. NPDC093595]|uniref:hypothetical protein n=1 Tax=Streptomyces sp. NPDC093595 TaxID=3366045 RepID=UPI003820BB64